MPAVARRNIGDIQVIPGVTEGLYGWIATNYLMGSFDAPEKHDHGKQKLRVFTSIGTDPIQKQLSLKIS
jgi:Golgi nucleoside diphosphatase